MTSSFNIQPASQVRDTFEAPEAQADIQAPAQPEQVSQRRGGELLDFTSYQPDNRLKAKVESIQNAVETFQGLSRQNAKDIAEKKKYEASRLYDQMAQYEIETSEIGEAARQLRKKGRSDLAEQVVQANPWFKFYYQSKVAEGAGSNAILHTSNYVNNNMGRLQQVEDPTQITKEIYGETQRYLKQKYPGIPDRLYAGLVDPVLAKNLPKLVQNVQEKQREYQVTNLYAGSSKSIKDQLVRVAAVERDPNRKPGDLEQEIINAQNAIMQAREDVKDFGLTYKDFENSVFKPLVTELTIDLPFNDQTAADGYNDLADKGLLNTMFKVFDGVINPDNPNETILDMYDLENNRTYREALVIVSRNAVTAKEKYETMLAQRASRESTNFSNDAETTLEYIRRTTPGGAEEKQAAVDAKLLEIQQTPAGQPVSMTLLDEDGNFVTVDRVRPAIVGAKDISNVGKRVEVVIPKNQYLEDFEEITERLKVDPNQDFSDILNQYANSGEQLSTLTQKIIKAKATFNDQVYKTETNGLVTFGKEVLNKLHADAVVEYGRTTPKSTRQMRTLKGSFKAAKDAQALLIEPFVRSIVADRIDTADPNRQDLRDPNSKFWTDTKAIVEAGIRGEELFTGASGMQQFMSSGNRTELFPLFATEVETQQVGENTVKTIVATPAATASPEQFIQLNQAFVNGTKYNQQLKDYYKEEPMMSFDVAMGLSGAFANPNNSFSDTHVAELKPYFDLAQRINPDVSLKEFLKGQLEKVYDVRGIKLDDNKVEQLSNKLNTDDSRSTVVKWKDLNHSHNNAGETKGGIDFWLQDKQNKLDVHFVAPTNLRILGTYFAPGDFGHYSVAQVLTPYKGLKTGMTIRIGHARSFNVQAGQVLSAGSIWGRQHTEETYRVGVDQAPVPGAGVHLHVDVSDANGVRLTQAQMKDLFLNTLVNHLGL